MRQIRTRIAMFAVAVLGIFASDSATAAINLRTADLKNSKEIVYAPGGNANVPKSGTFTLKPRRIYRFELGGASGNSNSGTAGGGGLAVGWYDTRGNVSDVTAYYNAGTVGDGEKGGFNGGGNGGSYGEGLMGGGGGGGGATDIRIGDSALTSRIIVAGGGGGYGGWYPADVGMIGYNNGWGGGGGGYIGLDGSTATTGGTSGGGGTQSGAGAGSGGGSNGSSGSGGNGVASGSPAYGGGGGYHGGGGGGGYYGGGGGGIGGGGGGGGSSYIGGVDSLIDSAASTQSGTRRGAGEVFVTEYRGYLVEYNPNNGGLNLHTYIYDTGVFVGDALITTMTSDETGFTPPAYAPYLTGWNTKGNGTGTAYDVGQPYIVSDRCDDVHDDIITLYAQWSAEPLPEGDDEGENMDEEWVKVCGIEVTAGGVNLAWQTNLVKMVNPYYVVYATDNLTNAFMNWTPHYETNSAISVLRLFADPLHRTTVNNVPPTQFFKVKAVK